MATKTETQINELKINYLTEAQYEEALANNEINDNEIYMTPSSENSSGGGTSDGNITYSLSKSGSTITLTGSDGSTSSVTDLNTTYSNASTSTAGLMSSSDKEKLDGIESGANNYTLPTASSSTLGGVKTTSSVTSTSGLTACPIISGVPYYKDTNTTYSNATTSTAGLMSASDKEKLDGLGESSNSSQNVFYGTCSTYAETTEKTVSVVSGDFTLTTGVRISVKFTKHLQCYDATLNVNNTGAKSIYWHGASLGEDQFWKAGAVVDFVYDGSVWEIVGIVNAVAPFSYVSGKEQFSLTSTTSTKTFTISYGVEFESAPVVMLTIQDGYTSNATDVIARLDATPTVSSFIVNIASINNTAVTGAYVNWVAIGVVSSN